MARKGKLEKARGAADGQTAPATTTVASATSSLEGDGGLAERTRQRAREIYEQRKATGLPGDAESDWFQAEAELGGPTTPRR